MKILYNPPNGAPFGTKANGFYYEGQEVDDHLPGKLLQYEDKKGEFFLGHYPFLEEVTAERAQEILSKPQKAKFACKYCDFSSDTHIALLGHMRKHKNEIDKEKVPLLDPNLVPVSGGLKVSDTIEEQIKASDPRHEIKNGIDRDGVEWYGEGTKESSMSQMPADNRGHFGRQPIVE